MRSGGVIRSRRRGTFTQRGGQPADISAEGSLGSQQLCYGEVMEKTNHVRLERSSEMTVAEDGRVAEEWRACVCSAPVLS